MTNSYVPGVCNIGPAEIAQRRNTGIAGAAVAVAAVVATVAVDAPRPWRALIALPAAVAAAGRLQARLHFCAGFGLRGVFNTGTSTGHQDTVDEAEFRRADQQRARAILAASAGIGMTVAGAAMLLPGRAR